MTYEGPARVHIESDNHRDQKNLQLTNSWHSPSNRVVTASERISLPPPGD